MLEQAMALPARIPPDKALHMLTGIFLFAVLHFFSVPAAVAGVVIAAVSKEIYDRMHADQHTCDVWDAIATIIGGLIGLLCWWPM
jgi:dolichol kinase